MKKCTIYTAEDDWAGENRTKLNDTVTFLYPSPANHVLVFPEQQAGPTGCIRLLIQHLISHPEVVVFTMFPDLVNFMGELIEQFPKKFDCSIVLIRKDVASVHEFTANGVLDDNWPFGCLQPDNFTGVELMRTLV